MTRISNKDRVVAIEMALRELLLEDSIPKNRKQALDLIFSIGQVCISGGMLNDMPKKSVREILVQQIKHSF